jgi:quercetin dioxygenase-like cupin family protein
MMAAVFEVKKEIPRKEIEMKTKTKLLIGAAAISSVIVGLAWATPIFRLASPVLATGNDNSNIEAHGVFETSNGEFKANLKTEGPSTIFVQDAAFSPGGHTGWHSHPGLLTLALIAGRLEWYNGNCELTIYNAGDAWTEGSQLHYFRSVGKVNVHLMVTYIIAQGATPRIDKPAPKCAAALGLD